MAEGGEGVVVNPDSESFELISAAFEEYEKALNDRQPVANTPNLDAFLREFPTEKLERARDLLHRMSIPQVLFHHEWIETTSQQTSEDQDDRVLSIYEFVKEMLDSWTGSLGSREHGQPECKKTDSTYQLIVWSAELWFFQQIEGLNRTEIQHWISNEGAEKLFKKYFAPLDEDAPRFTVLNKENACMLLRQLLRVSKFKSMLKQFLFNWRNIRKISADSSVKMSSEMAKIYDSSSENYYVFASEPMKRMYGMHFYLTNFIKKDDSGNEVPDEVATRQSIKEARHIRQALKKCSFHLRAPSWDQFNPANGTFHQLQNWLFSTLKRIQQKCSMLFVSFSVRGIQGHIMDTNKQYEEIETVLRWLNDHPDLPQIRETRKVVIIQACQLIPDERFTEQFNRISKRLGVFIREETRHMRLLMAADGGERYLGNFTESYLLKIAKAMKALQELDQPTIGEIHKQGHEGDVEKADKTQIFSAEVKDTVLSSASTAAPKIEESENESNSDDDGHLMVTDSEEEVEKAEDDDVVVG